MNASSHDTSVRCEPSTPFRGSLGFPQDTKVISSNGTSIYKSVLVWKCLTVSDGNLLCLWGMEPQWLRVFFLLLLSNKTTAHRGPCLTAHTNSFYPLSSQTNSVLYASSMQLLIWTVTLCLCVAAVTLSHDWRPARLLVANLRHTHSTECFLNRIVTAPVQAPSKQCSFPNCWLPLEKTQVGPSFYQKGGNILEREALISLSLNPPPTFPYAIPYDTMKDSDPLSNEHEIWRVSQSGSPL